MGFRSWFQRRKSASNATPSAAGAAAPSPRTRAERLVRDRVQAGHDANCGDLPDTERVVRADFLRSVVLSAQNVRPDSIRISGAIIDGDLDFSYAQLDRPLSLFACHFDGGLKFGRCKLPGLDVLACRVDGGIWADSVDVAYTLDVEASFIAGGASLMGAKIGADLNCAGAQIRPDGRGVALHLGNADVGAKVYLGVADLPTDDEGITAQQPFTATGEIRLMLAKIGDAFAAGSAQLDAAGGRHAINGEGADIGASLLLGSANVSGEISLVGAKIGADANFAGATLLSEEDALTLDGSAVAGNVLFTDKFSATGTVRLIGGEFKSSLLCNEASFSRTGGVALAVDGATIAMWVTLKQVTFDGGVRLYRTSADGLEDDLGSGEDKLGSWSAASPLVLTAFSVKRFAGEWDPELREKWLKKSDHFDPGTWESLIAVYRAHGRDGDARKAEIARENDRLSRGGLSWWRWLGGWIMRGFIGHGYRPLRAGLWALLVVVTFAILVDRGDKHIDALMGAPHSKPQPFIYAADVFLPIIDFGETKYWRVDGWLEWTQWAVIALGWVLTTLFVAGFGKLVRS
jgi:hypothetical protein